MSIPITDEARWYYGPELAAEQPEWLEHVGLHRTADSRWVLMRHVDGTVHPVGVYDTWPKAASEALLIEEHLEAKD